MYTQAMLDEINRIVSTKRRRTGCSVSLAGSAGLALSVQCCLTIHAPGAVCCYDKCVAMATVTLDARAMLATAVRTIQYTVLISVRKNFYVKQAFLSDLWLVRLQSAVCVGFLDFSINSSSRECFVKFNQNTLKLTI